MENIRAESLCSRMSLHKKMSESEFHTMCSYAGLDQMENLRGYVIGGVTGGSLLVLVLVFVASVALHKRR